MYSIFPPVTYMIVDRELKLNKLKSLLSQGSVCMELTV